MIEVRLPSGNYVKMAHRWAIVDYVIGPEFLVTIGNTVYVSSKKSLESISLPQLAHEYRHIQQQNEMGSFLFYIKYMLFRKFRLDVEADAYAAQIANTLRLEIKTETIHKAATWLSSWQYFWCASTYEEALTKIKSKCSYRDLI